MTILEYLDGGRLCAWLQPSRQRDEEDEDNRSDIVKRKAIIRSLLQEGADVETAALHADPRCMSEADDHHLLHHYTRFHLGTLQWPYRNSWDETALHGGLCE